MYVKLWLFWLFGGWCDVTEILNKLRKKPLFYLVSYLRVIYGWIFTLPCEDWNCFFLPCEAWICFWGDCCCRRAGVSRQREDRPQYLVVVHVELFIFLSGWSMLGVCLGVFDLRPRISTNPYPHAVSIRGYAQYVGCRWICFIPTV